MNSLRPSVFNQGDSTTGSASEFRSEGGSDSFENSAKARRLADLFRPPFDIMHKGSFEEVKTKTLVVKM